VKIENSKEEKAPLPPVFDEGNQTNKSVRLKGHLESSCNIQARDTLNCEIARMFYSLGLPFNLARSPYYRSAFSYAANTSNFSGYVPPTYNKLRGHLLSKERIHVENLLQPIRNSWKHTRVTIVSDGWSDPQRRPLINFMVVTESGPMFLKSIDASDEIKDKDFMARHMRDIIMEVEPNNVVQIITDNAIVCKVAGILIELEFPSIYWTHCVVHTLNLALKNICATKNTEKNSVAYHQLVKEILLDDNWWMKVDYILAFTHPIYDVLRKTDTNTSTLDLVYEIWDSMIENVIFQHERKTEVEHSSFFDVVNSILIDRWTKSSTSLHYLIYNIINL